MSGGKMLKDCIQLLTSDPPQPLPPGHVRAAMHAIMAGSAGAAEMAALLLALRISGQTSVEVVSVCAEVMLEFARPCRLAGSPVDIVGTGGDGRDTFNVSTAAGFVMAACGCTVAKHGNRSSSGNVGSADFLQALGANIFLDGPQTAEVIAGCGFGFLFAQQFHPAMKNVAAVRKAIGVRTIFNILGPLTSPVQPSHMVVGVGAPELGPLFAELFQRRGADHVLVVHATDGMDEISIDAESIIWEVRKGQKIERRTISPMADFGLPGLSPLEAVIGCTAAERAHNFRQVLTGARGPLRDFIVINAAAGIYVAGKAATLAAAARQAEAVLDSGAALAVLEKYLTLSQAAAVQPGLATPAPEIINDPDVPVTRTYSSKGGITVHHRATLVDGASVIEQLIDRLDTNRGALFASSYEYPGRYTRWDLGFSDPPVVLTTAGRTFTVEALNVRGRVLLAPLFEHLEQHPHVVSLQNVSTDRFVGVVKTSTERISEEERSKQPTVFSVVRNIIQLFYHDEEDMLGLYGAFGYDLCFQFESTEMRRERPVDQRDLVLYIPDCIIAVDHAKQKAWQHEYDFETSTGASTVGLPRQGISCAFRGRPQVDVKEDHAPGEYAAKVRLAREKFKKGDLFEAVLSQTFYEPCPAPPSELFRRLRLANPAPYGFIINLGAEEYLVGASPEMYVRVQGDRVETCPISGTIKRGKDAIADAQQVRELLNSAKEESELTMCTDVDRNDKSRICIPGSVRVIARRQIEMYSRLIHTVDHVEGFLRPEFDALDAFLCHAWAVTVTGAPKNWAMQFVEDQEKSPRAWYAGAVGVLNFNSDMNTGLTLRTIRIHQGIASVRAGATLLWDSDPEAEEAETRLKASAFLDALRIQPKKPQTAATEVPALISISSSVLPRPLRVLLIDHEDSFVHTLANYLRQTGAEVVTQRAGFGLELLDSLQPELVVLSPGPGTPADFDLSRYIAACVQRRLPIFGVCLGLQGMVEHFGGTLDVLAEPVHGKPGVVQVHRPSYLFQDMPDQFVAARYHSLFADRPTFPCEQFHITASTPDNCVMAIEHVAYPMAAVQFHPESLLTAHNTGMQILHNVIARFFGRSQAVTEQ